MHIECEDVCMCGHGIILRVIHFIFIYWMPDCFHLDGNGFRKKFIWIQSQCVQSQIPIDSNRNNSKCQALVWAVAGACIFLSFVFRMALFPRISKNALAFSATIKSFLSRLKRAFLCFFLFVCFLSLCLCLLSLPLVILWWRRKK